MGVTTKFLKGESILEEGRAGDRAYQIRQGEVLVFKQTVGKKLLPLAKLGPGDIVGEMFIDQDSGKRSASAVALSDVELDVFFEEDISQMLNKTPPFIRSVMTTLSKRLKSVTSSLVENTTKPLDGGPKSNVLLNDQKVQSQL